VFALRPVTAADTATALLPDPGDGAHVVLDPYDVEVPYSSLQSLTDPPLGFTVALSDAAVCAIDDAVSVAAVGGFGSVWKVWSLPVLVPPELIATIRKW
jgi:hypothetical protein